MKALSIKDAKEKRVSELSPAAILAVLSVGRDRLHFGYDKVRKLANEFVSQIDSVNSKYVSFQDMKEYLTENDNIDFPYNFGCDERISTTKGMREFAEYTSRASSIAVLCTVLCDKFGMKKVKVTQAIKQFNDIFDGLKNDRQMINQLKDEFYRDYQICIN